MTQAEQVSTGEGHRPDLEGLRGVAILLVLLFHAGIPGTTGGFVGVDVFFVLSGFLITGVLLREHAATGRIDLPTFYARRARRILPAAIAVTLATLGASWLVLAPLDVPGVATDAAAVTLFVGNIHFAITATDYFAVGAAPSPLLHYWSLGVEEQFYLLWPALLILAMRVWRPRVSAGIVMVVLLVTSFGAALYMTGVSAPWAFYSLPTRAWELALGGLLAVTAAVHHRIPGAVMAPLGWLGLILLGLALVWIDPATPYPGVMALLPTLGAAAIVLAGDRRWSPGALLSVPPMRLLGRISYSLYLVHWPILILPAALLAPGMEIPLTGRVGLALLAIAVGWVSFRLIEEPFHVGRFVVPKRRTLAAALAATTVTLAVVMGVGLAATRVVQEIGTVPPGGASSGPVPGPTQSPIAITAGGGDDVGPDDTPPPDLVLESEPPLESVPPEPSLPPQPTETPTPSNTPAPSASPASTNNVPPTPTPLPTGTSVPATPGPTPAPTPAVTPRPSPTKAPVTHYDRVPVGLRPALANARGDQEALLHDGCGLGYPRVDPPHCSYGDAKGSIIVALVGDSHASQWFPALERLSRQHHWRLVPFTKLSCRFIDLPIYSRVLERPYTECTAWRERVVAHLQALKPDLVVVAVARGPQTINPGDNDPRVQGTALARLLKRIPGRIAILIDTPQSYYDVPACLSRYPSNVARCQTPRSAAFGWRFRIVERTAAKASGAAILDLSGATCPGDPCPVIVNGILVYRDTHHMTATFANSLAPALHAALKAALPTLARSTRPTSETNDLGRETAGPAGASRMAIRLERLIGSVRRGPPAAVPQVE